jgi:hypothetical protein
MNCLSEWRNHLNLDHEHIDKAIEQVSNAIWVSSIAVGTHRFGSKTFAHSKYDQNMHSVEIGLNSPLVRPKSRRMKAA